MPVPPPVVPSPTALRASAPPGPLATGVTPWAGWQLVRPGGPTDAYGSARVAAAGDAVLVVQGDGFQTTSGTGPGGAGQIRALSTGGGPPAAPVVLPTRRLVVPDAAGASVSDDRGAHWRRAAYPAVGDGVAVGPVFSPSGRGLVVVSTPKVAYDAAYPAKAAQTGPAVLASDDGGDHWSVVHPAEAGGARAASARSTARGSGDRASTRAPQPTPDPVSRVTVESLVARPGGRWFRVVAVAGAPSGDPSSTSGAGTSVLERSDDDGRTWTAVPLPAGAAPDLPDPVAAGAPAAATGTPALLAGGAVVVPAGDALLVSDDDLRTFRRVVPPGADPHVLCDAAGACLVDVADPQRAGGRFAVPFDGTTFGERRPALPGGAVSAAPGVVVGIELARGDGPDGGTRASSTTVAGPAVVRSLDGGRTYAADPRIPGGVRTVTTTGAGTLRARVADGVLETTHDGLRWARTPLPGPDPVVAVTEAPAGLVALDTLGRVHRRADGRWTSWSAASIGPRAVTTAGDAIVVAGSRGVLLRSGDRSTQVLRLAGEAVRGAGGPATVLPRGFGGVAGRGRVVLAWGVDDGRTPPDGAGEGGLLRSGDGGRTWRRVPGPRVSDDAQVLPGGLAFVGSRAELWRSTDGGRRFALLARLPAASTAVLARVGFQDARRGIVRSSATVDGGRTFVGLPVVPSGTTLLGLGDAGDVVETGPLGSIVRFPGLLGDALRPRIAASVVRGARSRTAVLRVRGRTRNVPAGTAILFDVAASPGAKPRDTTGRAGVVGADGTFTGTIASRVAGDRVWRARALPSAGVAVDRTTLRSQSPWTRLSR